jgi:hypothetical protein
MLGWFLVRSFHGKYIIAICGFKDLYFGLGINGGLVVSEDPSTHSMYDRRYARHLHLGR